MKFRCERDLFLEAVATASRAVNPRSSHPVLSGILFEFKENQIQITGSDLDLTITVFLDIQIEEPGSFVAPARLITEIIKSLNPGFVEITSTEEELQIKSGRADFAIQLLPVEDFPSLDAPKTDSVVIPTLSFVEAIRQVIRAASNDDSRPMLTGVLLASEENSLRMVATDSYRLAIRDIEGQSVLQKEQRVLVPARALGELQRLLSSEKEVTLKLGNFDVIFETGNVKLRTRLLETEFPNYQQLLPSGYPNKLNIERIPFLEALKRVKLLVQDTTSPIRLTLSENSVELSVITHEVGRASETVPAEYSGEEMTIAFNPNYLIEGTEATKSKNIIIEALNTLKPVTLKPDNSDEKFIYLLMPIRIN